MINKFFNKLVAVPIYGLGVDDSNESVIKFMGIMKVTISFVKYCPQVYLNWKRKSTLGWSLENVILDLTGGLLTFLQIIFDKMDGKATNLFSGSLNIAKFALSIISASFDFIFLFQHFILYHGNESENEDFNQIIDIDISKEV